MTTKKDYDTEAARLAKAIDLAIESFKRYPPKDFTETHVEHVIKVYTDFKHSALNPEPKYKKIASLKYDIQNVFTYFQEATGKTVEYFWEQVNKENLGYVREDKMSKILERGKIKGRKEYEYVIDLITVTKQIGRINNEESLKLNNMIGEFEGRKRK